MAQAHPGIVSTAEQFSERLQALERRVAALEAEREQSPRVGSEPKPVVAMPPPLLPSNGRHGFAGLDLSTGVVAVPGTAVLGIAGAYLLRALSESGTAPHVPILAVAILYAWMWLVWAARIHTKSRFAGVTYGISSALIFCPLLWEATVRFQVLSPAVAAVALVAFVVLAIALSWRQDLQAVPWVTILPTVTTAVALISATRELVAFTAALLAIALATEVAACLGHRLNLRAIPAIAADFAIWLLIDLMTARGGAPPGYRQISATILASLCLSLLAVYGASIGFRSFALRQGFTVFEIVQGVAAFSLAVWGSLRASQGVLAPALGVFCFLVAAVCYWGALSRFAPEAGARNRRVCATYAAVLLLAGSFMLFSADVQVLFFSAAAVTAAFLYLRTGKLTLGMQASFCLAAAAIDSPFLNYAENALAGTVPANRDWRVWVVAASALLCYTIGSQVSEDRPKRRLLWLIPAVMAGFAMAALTVVAITWLAAGRVEVGPSRLSVVRTVVTCLLAVALSWLGSRSRRVELVWVAYATVALGALKLLVEDLRFGNAGSLVVSLLCYGLILILIPKLTRLGQVQAT